MQVSSYKTFPSLVYQVRPFYTLFRNHFCQLLHDLYLSFNLVLAENTMYLYIFQGVGRSLRDKLEALSVITCADLQQIPLASLQKELGVKTGDCDVIV